MLVISCFINWQFHFLHVNLCESHRGDKWWFVCVFLCTRWSTAWLAWQQSLSRDASRPMVGRRPSQVDTICTAWLSLERCDRSIVHSESSRLCPQKEQNQIVIWRQLHRILCTFLISTEAWSAAVGVDGSLVLDLTYGDSCLDDELSRLQPTTTTTTDS